MPLRDLKRSDSRRSSPLMATPLSKNCNDEDGRFRPRPSGPLDYPDLFVVFFRQADACLQKDASTSEQSKGQRRHGIVQWSPSTMENELCRQKLIKFVENQADAQCHRRQLRRYNHLLVLLIL